MKNTKMLSLYFCIMGGCLFSGCGNKGPLYLPQADKAKEPVMNMGANERLNAKTKASVSAGLCPFSRMIDGQH